MSQICAVGTTGTKGRSVDVAATTGKIFIGPTLPQNVPVKIKKGKSERRNLSVVFENKITQVVFSLASLESVITAQLKGCDLYNVK